mmetsp:Transcript_14542/g.20741  ORF Transcript_14542/g.20741 Transcript_14542/m.20741 type:complete len:276 (-) Transcript_14542:689-1516(-)
MFFFCCNNKYLLSLLIILLSRVLAFSSDSFIQLHQPPYQTRQNRSSRNGRNCDLIKSRFPNEGIRIKYPSVSSVQTEKIDENDYYVRPGKYSDMGRVANILVDSFFNPSTLVRPYVYLSELQRLQSNFPYDGKLHAVFVVCCRNAAIGKKEDVIGFVDIDARPLDENQVKDGPPRPYLSDLAVHHKWRRKGVAKSLIMSCEKIVKTWDKKELYLRVERKNTPALNMYKSLGYSKIPHHYFGIKDTTILLRRQFSVENKLDHIENHVDLLVTEYVI